MTDVSPEPSFDDLEWTVTADGAREKVVERDGKRVRLVELTDAFVHDEWCSKGHIVSVLDGTLELTFRDRVENIEAGDLCSIPSGYEHRHKPRALTLIVQMLVIDEPNGELSRPDEPNGESTRPDEPNGESSKSDQP